MNITQTSFKHVNREILLQTSIAVFQHCLLCLAMTDVSWGGRYKAKQSSKMNKQAKYDLQLRKVKSVALPATCGLVLHHPAIRYIRARTNASGGSQPMMTSNDHCSYCCLNPGLRPRSTK